MARKKSSESGMMNDLNMFIDEAKQDKISSIIILIFLAVLAVGSVLTAYMGAAQLPTYGAFSDTAVGFLVAGLFGVILVAGVWLGLTRQRYYAFLWVVLAFALLFIAIFLKEVPIFRI